LNALYQMKKRWLNWEQSVFVGRKEVVGLNRTLRGQSLPNTSPSAVQPHELAARSERDSV
jgi:hypothetical protein